MACERQSYMDGTLPFRNISDMCLRQPSAVEEHSSISCQPKYSSRYAPLLRLLALVGPHSGSL